MDPGFTPLEPSWQKAGHTHGWSGDSASLGLSVHLCAWVRAKSLQSCPTGCSPPGSSVHRILQARILEWLPCPPPGDLPDPGIEPKSLALSSAFQADSFLLSHQGSPFISVEWQGARGQATWGGYSMPLRHFTSVFLPK